MPLLFAVADGAHRCVVPLLLAVADGAQGCVVPPLFAVAESSAGWLTGRSSLNVVVSGC